MSTKRKAPAKLAPPAVKVSAQVPTKSTINEARASIAGPDAVNNSMVETISISSDDGSDNEDNSDEETKPTIPYVDRTKPLKQEALLHPQGDIKRKLKLESSLKTEADADELDEDGEPTSPSFGDLLRGTEVIEVADLLQQSTNHNSLSSRPSKSTAITPPSLGSLSTVLTQALKTDDLELLESCLHVSDIPTIQNTIERMDSSLAGSLLTHLASRLHRRPGRAGHLMTWVRWTLIAHGGVIAAQPKVIQSLNSLQKVLAERARGLNSLLALKGKLDLLDGQIQLRQKMRQNYASIRGVSGEDDDNLIYVEGETDDYGDASLINGVGVSRKGQADNGLEVDDGLNDIAAMGAEIADSEDDEDSNDAEDVSEDGAQEESLDEDEVDHDDIDDSMGEEEESEVEAAAPPQKMQKVSRPGSRRK